MDGKSIFAVDAWMSPARGLGIDIARLIMLLTGAYSIKAAIAFE